MSKILQNWLPVLLWGMAVPLSLFMWLANLTMSKFWFNEFEDSHVVPPTRWLFSTSVPLAMMMVAWRRRSVDKSGAALGLVMAFFLSLANHAFFTCLVVFFFSSSKATEFRGYVKRKIETNFKENGQRNWIQALCNVGVATLFAVLYLIDCGSSERSIDFVNDFRASWLSISVMSSLACCNGDTLASELGTVLSPDDPYLITTFKRVPRGTNGAISCIGLVVSWLGGLLVGFAYFLTVHLTVFGNQMLISPPQWPLIIFGSVAGLLGSVVDSFLGATIQFSGINPEGKIVEDPAEGTRHISGLRIIDNHSVNLLSCIATGITMPCLASKYWPDR